MRPLYIVKSQLKTLTPVGIAMIMVAVPKKVLTASPPPIVKKWCPQTMIERIKITRTAQTIEV